MADRRPERRPDDSNSIDIDIATTDELAAMAAGGDGHAFARLIRLHGEAMTRVAWLVTGHMPAAVEAVRSAWVAAWPDLRKPREPSDPVAWLCRLAALEAERIVHMAVGDVLPPGWPAWGGESAIDLGALAPAERSLLALHHLAGLTPDELDRLAGRGVPRRIGRRLRVHRPLRPGATRHAESSAARLAGAWAAIGLDEASAHERIVAMADVPVRPVDADAIARLARFEERETSIRIASALVGLAAGVIVALVPVLAGLATGGR